MNITKDLYDYVSSTKQTIPHFTFKCEQYSAMHKCNRLLQQINEAERNIAQITSMSKKSSAFNDHHLKFSNASSNIKRSLIDIEQEMKNFKVKELNNPSYSVCESKIISNSFDFTLKYRSLKNRRKINLLKESKHI